MAHVNYSLNVQIQIKIIQHVKVKALLVYGQLKLIMAHSLHHVQIIHVKQGLKDRFAFLYLLLMAPNIKYVYLIVHLYV